MKIFYSIKCEQLILSSIILNNKILLKFKNILKIEDFYFKNHKIIFKEILNFNKKNKYFDLLILSDKIKNLFKFNIFKYLKFIIQLTPSPSNIINYIYILNKLSTLRKLILNSKNVLENVINYKNINLYKFLNNLELNICCINKNFLKKDLNKNLIKNIFKKFIKNVKNTLKNPNNLNNFSTGFYKLDNILSGINNGDLIIIAGRPSMGKTTFAINIAQNISIKYKIPVIIFSMEMTREQLITRIVSSLSNINQNLIKSGNLLKKDFKRLKFVINKIYNHSIFIDETATVSPLNVYYKLKKIIRNYGNIGLVIIDYLQLMVSDDFNQNRVIEISDILRSLKSIAKELDLPIIVISQLNRSLESRNIKKPIMSDLRESGSIEQDADIILFLYRDEIYNLNSKNIDEAEIIIAKQRNGPLGSVFLNFSKKNLKFNNI